MNAWDWISLVWLGALSLALVFAADNIKGVINSRHDRTCERLHELENENDLLKRLFKKWTEDKDG
jgi:hypothetical protein